MVAKRNRKLFSVKNELIEKSREAMLCAVQIFNNPKIQFKSESFIILAIIAWTYLLHAYFRENSIEYRYFKQAKSRKKFDKTKHGAFKHWELERCLDEVSSSIDTTTVLNLRFLIGLRHEIEHQMTTKIDDLLSARFQACCLNYNEYLKKLFWQEYWIEKYLSFSLQFSSISESQIESLSEKTDLPKHIKTYVDEFDSLIDESAFNDSRYSYRVLIFQKQANRKWQADRVIEFIDPKSDIAKWLNKEYWVVKDKEKQKHLPGKIVKQMQNEWYNDFSITSHTYLWQKLDAKNLAKWYGTMVEKTWYWYDNWIDLVREDCEKRYTT